MPHSVQRLRYLAAVLVATLLVAVSVAAPIKAHAAVTPVASFLLLAGQDPGTAPKGTVYATNTTTVNVPNGMVFLASTPDGQGRTSARDFLDFQGDGITHFGEQYFRSCTEPVSLDPIYVNDWVPPGTHTITTTAINSCGTTTGLTDIWLVVFSSSPPPPPASCPPLKFFGVRGSGETAGDHGGFGTTIASMKDRLAAKVPGLAMEALDYPAIPVDLFHPTYPVHYVDSVWEGKNRLLDHVAKFIADCPTSYVMLAGYSQGADVVQTAYLEMTDSTRKHIASVDFFGNPSFNPKQPSINIGDFNPKLAGILFVGDKIPSKWTSRVNSFCIAGDPICNFSNRNAAICLPLLPSGLCAHQRYDEKRWTTKAADSAVAQWKKLPRLR